MNLLEKVRERNRRRNLEWSLDEARWYYFTGDPDKAILLLLELDASVIQEPPFDSEEYRDGERKSATPDDEPQEEETELLFDSAYDGLYPERDSDGYLIR